MGSGVQAMVGRETLRLIRRVVLEEAGRLGVVVEEIILFGSRARGDYRENSDYDILIIVGGELDWRGRFKLQSRVRTRLYRLLGNELDLIVVDRRRFEERKNLRGSIEHAAYTEGVVA